MAYLNERGAHPQQSVTAATPAVMSYATLDDRSRTVLQCFGVSKGTQIFYSPNHWVAMAYEGDDVFVANSLGSTISWLVTKQLKQLEPPPCR